MRVIFEKGQTKFALGSNEIWELVKVQLLKAGFNVLVNGTSMEIITQLYRGSSRSKLEIEDNHQIIFCIKPIEKGASKCQESGKQKKRGS